MIAGSVYAATLVEEIAEAKAKAQAAKERGAYDMTQRLESYVSESETYLYEIWKR